MTGPARRNYNFPPDVVSELAKMQQDLGFANETDTVIACIRAAAKLFGAFLGPEDQTLQLIDAREGRVPGRVTHTFAVLR